MPRNKPHPPLLMTDDFSVLFDLLGYEKTEVAGRGSLTMPREFRENLAKLAAGRCNDEERRDLLSALSKQPELISELVNEIRKLRGASR